MLVLVTYVPEPYVEKVKKALFESGAGAKDGYSCCCWQTLGMGQFMALEGSNPFIGEQDKIEKVPEIRLEMIVDEQNAANAVAALLSSHPYEVPAYHLIPVMTIENG